jgi:hypothetical protein
MIPANSDFEFLVKPKNPLALMILLYHPEPLDDTGATRPRSSGYRGTLAAFLFQQLPHLARQTLSVCRVIRTYRRSAVVEGVWQVRTELVYV